MQRDRSGEAAVAARAMARAVGLRGSPNFRDAGGYPTGDGGRVRWRRLFRSGHLAALEADDEQRLGDLALDLVIDLRRRDECAAEPSRLPPGVRVYNAAVSPGSQANALLGEGGRIASGEAMFAFMCAINREFVESQSGIFAAAFAEILDSGAQRVLLHCSAGKDRTGFAIAMLQLALGVGRDDVMADYLLSADYYVAQRELPRARRKYVVDHLEDPHILPLLSVDAAYLAAALTAIEATHGDPGRYLERGLGLDAAARRELRRRFMEG